MEVGMLRLAACALALGAAACAPPAVKQAEPRVVETPVASEPKPIRPFADLPETTRPEIRAQIEASAWMQRLRSATGWMVVEDVERETLLRNARERAPNLSCL